MMNIVTTVHEPGGLERIRILEPTEKLVEIMDDIAVNATNNQGCAPTPEQIESLLAYVHEIEVLLTSIRRDREKLHESRFTVSHFPTNPQTGGLVRPDQPAMVGVPLGSAQHPDNQLPPRAGAQ